MNILNIYFYSQRFNFYFFFLKVKFIYFLFFEYFLVFLNCILLIYDYLYLCIIASIFFFF
ncbi:hypothetical protein H8356DRAFT_1684322, partial [Neocallimastix lanati (nom. inval.)]